MKSITLSMCPRCNAPTQTELIRKCALCGTAIIDCKLYRLTVEEVMLLKKHSTDRDWQKEMER